MSIESVIPSPTISSSASPFSSCCQSLLASGSFPMSQLFTSDGQSIGASASTSVRPIEYSGLISFTIDWFDLFAVQGTLKSLLQHSSSKASILWHSGFFIVQLSQPYITTGKTIVLTRSTVKNLPAVWETWIRSLGLKDFLREEMATSSSILSWRIPWTEEPGGLQSMELQIGT